MVTLYPEQARRGGPPPAGRGVFEAIADPTRRGILDRLGRGPLPAGEVARGFPMSRPAISKHLRALESAGLVRVSSEGRKRVYEIRREPLAEVDLWLSRHRVHHAANLAAIKANAEADRPHQQEGDRDDG